MYKHYAKNQKEVNETYGNHIYNYDCDGKDSQDTVNDLSRMLRVRFR